jgi:hypothetical protein
MCESSSHVRFAATPLVFRGRDLLIERQAKKRSEYAGGEMFAMAGVDQKRPLVWHFPRQDAGN